MDASQPTIKTFEDLECWRECRALRLFVAIEILPACRRMSNIA